MAICCLRLSDVSVICRVVNPRRTSQKIWEGFLYGVYRPGNDSELILTIKVETRNPVEGYFGSEFPAICNHCGVIAVWSRKTFKKLRNFAAFVGKTTPYGKIFENSVPKVFIATPIDVLCSFYFEIWPTVNRWHRASLARADGQCQYWVQAARRPTTDDVVLELLK